MSWFDEKVMAEMASGEWIVVESPRAADAYTNAVLSHASDALLLDLRGELRHGTQPLWQGTANEALGLLAQGRVDVAFVEAAQVDRFGNLNHSYIGHYHHPDERLPGAGYLTDMTSLARRVVVLLDSHTPERLVEEVGYITAPGSGTGSGWREGAGLPAWALGVTTLITPYALFRADEGGELQLVEIAPDTTLDTVRAATGWSL